MAAEKFFFSYGSSKVLKALDHVKEDAFSETLGILNTRLRPLSSFPGSPLKLFDGVLQLLAEQLRPPVLHLNLEILGALDSVHAPHLCDFQLGVHEEGHTLVGSAHPFLLNFGNLLWTDHAIFKQLLHSGVEVF